MRRGAEETMAHTWLPEMYTEIAASPGDREI